MVGLMGRTITSHNARQLAACQLVTSQLAVWSRTGLLVGMTVVTSSLSIAPGWARPLTLDRPAPNACQDAQFIPVSDANIQTLKKLVEKYKVELPLSLSLDGDQITRGEIITVLQLLKQTGNISVVDQQAIARLLSQYMPPFDDRERLESIGKQHIKQNIGGRYQQPMPMQSPINNPVPATAIAPIAPLTGLPAPSPLNQTTGGLKQRVAPSGSIPSRPPIVRPPTNEPNADEPWRQPNQPGNTEDYSTIVENPFLRPSSNPLSTFSIDVDTGSYSNVRRMIASGERPQKDAVRLEEMINYFPYNYAPPSGNQPFSVNTSVMSAPWNPRHQLVQIGLQGKQLETPPPSNLVFLLDVSGSMDAPNKLPLLKQSFCMMLDQLSAEDKVSIVVYAGSAGEVLPPTSGKDKQKIMAALDRLQAGGSTAGGQGIELAYKKAQQGFIKGGNNRVILATDGDFNVGASSDAALVEMIEKKRDRGIFLTVLGFGTGNYKDNKMEQLANKGNGNYAYIDTLAEARKVLVNDLRGTLFTIAKDVKLQVEFNPQQVQAYRLLGYENRALRDQDFNDDTKDAGEIGSGHRVTALYEVVPTGIDLDVKLPSVDGLKYQKVNPIVDKISNSNNGELMQVKLRYKSPNENKSELITQIIANKVEPGSGELKFAASVALFGMVLRDSEYKGQGKLTDVLALAEANKGDDREGYRSEFIRMVRRYSQLSEKKGD
jgi:Ca-activated chloride channel homolog